MSLKMQSYWARANACFRNKDYESAIKYYEEAILQAEPPLKTRIRFNLDIALRRAGKMVAPYAVLEKPEDLDQFYFDLIKDGGFFDPEWYLEQYKEKHHVTGNPLAHYLAHGVELGTNPSPQFDTTYYLKQNQDVAQSGIHPFLHYICQGCNEGRLCRLASVQDSLDTYQAEAPHYVPRLAEGDCLIEKAVRVIAFYLPQYHPIPENDEWWGKGFTEWTNVRPARPLFEGHYQPHEPDEFLGYYDLRDTSVMRKQIELAKQYGIEGFCFYTYWFSGTRLLETPVDNYLADNTLDLPFCICWANENWSRRWDGKDSDLLMVQHYSDQDDIAFISHMAKYLRDPRYIRVNGKPLLIVYRPNLFPSMSDTAMRWRDCCREIGLGEIYIAYVQSFEKRDPSDYGLDAAIEFPPNNSAPPDITKHVVDTCSDFFGRVYDWRIFLQRSQNFKSKNYTVLRGACPSWDNTARKKARGVVFAHSSPSLFERWLINVFEETLQGIKDADQRLVFINAWNEWGEGAHLEPDKRHGYAWLQAVRSAHEAVMSRRQKILIVSHDAHPHGAQLLSLNLAKHFKWDLNFQVDVIVLGEGVLLPRFAEHASVHRIDLETDSSSQIDANLSRIVRKGIRTAIVNTTVSGHIVPHLKKHGLKVVSLVHELSGVLYSYNLQGHANAIANYADKVIFAVPTVRDGFESFLGRSLSQSAIRPQGLYHRSWLRSGCDKEKICDQTRRQLGLPATAKIVLCVGYADYRKGFDLFFEICKLLMEKRADIYGLWVGHLDQSFVNAKMADVEKGCLSHRFIFTGLVDEPQPYYLASDVFALTSREDPFPSVVMEAFDAEIPVVAFRGCGGFEELLNRVGGVLVAKGDIGGFAYAVNELLETPLRALELARKGRKLVEDELNFRHYLYDLLDFGGQSIPRVSVIVPNYNYSSYLRDRLKTVSNQSLPLYELIVLDDCSQDNSLQVITEFLNQCDVPSQLVINSTNSGSVFRQWRKGVELARGEYVWIAEADDTCKPLLLERLINRMRKTGAIMGFSDSSQIDEEGRSIGDSYKTYVNLENHGAFDDSFIMEGCEFLARYLSVKNVILNVSAVIFRRDALLKALTRVGDELLGYKVAGDWRLYIEMCALNGQIVYVSESLNCHRLHQKSVTFALDVDKHLQEIVNIHAICNQMLPDFKGIDAQKKYLKHVKKYLDGINSKVV